MRLEEPTTANYDFGGKRMFKSEHDLFSDNVHDT